MKRAGEEILDRIDELLSEDEDFGRRVAHDLIERLAKKMENLASERIELDRKLGAAAGEPNRGSIVEEVAARIERTAGRTRVTKELIDSIIERLYRLDREQRKSISRVLVEKM